MTLHQPVAAARVTVDARSPVAPVHRRLFGAFVEQAARGVYRGLYEPSHPTADEHGFRGDVTQLIRELGVTTVRYPGGNQVSGYRWEDGIGPRSQRPVRRELAWLGTESNEVGTDEIAAWAERLGLELLLSANLGTRGLEETLDLVEYVNGAPGSTLADLRGANGYDAPHGVKMWFLGNEMDGAWQIGALDADEYGKLALRVARALHKFDPTLELAACGSSWSGSESFLEWDRTVLEHTFDEISHLSFHAYFQPRDGDMAEYLAAGADLEDQLAGVVATIDHVRHRRRSRKQISVSLDEWNVWYQGRPPTHAERADAVRFENREWPTAARQLEDVYTVTDAVVVGSLLITILRNADRLGSANLAQLVNVIAPIMTEPGGPAWRQTIYHPFAATARLARGQVIRTDVSSPVSPHERLGTVPLVDAVATSDEEATTVFAVNRSPTALTTVAFDLRSVGVQAVRQAWYLHDDDLSATNTQESPDRVTLRPLSELRLEDGRLTVTLPPVSWAAVAMSH